MNEYRLVPVEPTDEMATAAMNAEIHANSVYGEPAAFSDIWRVMLSAAPAVQGEPVAWMTHHDEPMLFLAEKEAAAYCYDDERPIPLYTAPQPAELEILGSYPVSGQIFFRGPSNEWVLELTGSVNGTRFTARHTQPADTRPEDVAGLPALYEPAPDVSELVALLDHAQCPNCDGSGARYDSHGEPEQCQWCYERAEALADYRQGGEE